MAKREATTTTTTKKKKLKKQLMNECAKCRRRLIGELFFLPFAQDFMNRGGKQKQKQSKC